MVHRRTIAVGPALGPRCLVGRQGAPRNRTHPDHRQPSSLPARPRPRGRFFRIFRAPDEVF